MTSDDDPRSFEAQTTSPDRVFRDLEEALGIVMFFATGLERALCDTHWKLESEQLAHAARRSVSAASALKECLPALRGFGPR
ncbi:MAG: hypothetical protein HYZ58_04845 [Acidobacteria bacterium]|nr:hypothetical protein [Acidobacteriota bacterium]